MVGQHKFLKAALVLLSNAVLSGSLYTPGNTYTSFQGEIVCSPSFPKEYPSTIQEVQEIVRRAISLNTTVKAIGSTHSVLDSICTDGIPIDMHNIKDIYLEPSTLQVKVGAGTELTDFVIFLESKGRALGGQTPSFGGVTIGGVLGTGARGSSLLYPTSFSDQIISVTIVDGEGNVQVIDESNPDFTAFRVHLGLMGILVDATFNTIPSYKMLIHNYKDSESILTNEIALAMAREHDWLQFWWFPSVASVVVSKGTYVSNETPGNAKTYMIPDLDIASVVGLRAAFEEAESKRSDFGLGTLQLSVEKSLYLQIPLRQPVFSEDGLALKNPAVGYVHNLMQNRCTKCAWGYGPKLSVYQQTTAFALDISNFTEAIKSIKDILTKEPAYFPVYGIFIRFSPASSALMSVEYGRETVHFEIVTPMRTNPFETSRAGLAAYQAIAQSLVQLGGRPHWSMGGLVFHTREMEQRNCPNIVTFRNLVTKYDPNGIFMNNFGRRVIGVADVLTLDPKVRHCALQDYCFCGLDSDCATGQTCSKLDGFNVCKDYLQITVLHNLPNSVLSFLHSILP